MGARTAIVTDSTCNIPRDTVAERHIHVVPLYVLIGEESFRDGIDITEEQLYIQMRESKALPKTSNSAPQDFALAFQQARAAEDADEVVCITLSSGLSGNHAMAVLARDLVDFPVHVIDSQGVSWELGHTVLSAADARDSGASPAEIAEAARVAAARQSLIFTIENLEWLRRGGRISGGKMLVGTALRIKPVLMLRGGLIEVVDNVRTRKTSLHEVLRSTVAFGNGRGAKRLAVCHGDSQADARYLYDLAIDELKPGETRFTDLTAVLGVHAGPGAVGLAVEWDS